MDSITKGKCAVCGEEEVQFFPADVHGWSPALAEGMEDDQMLDLGFGSHAAQINNAMLSRVSMCRHCGYCAADIFAPTEVKKSQVESTTYRSRLYIDGVSLKRMHYSAYSLASLTDDIDAMMYHLIVSDWNSRNDRQLLQISRFDRSFIERKLYKLPVGVLFSLMDAFRKRQDPEMVEKVIFELNIRDLTHNEFAIIYYQHYLAKNRIQGEFSVTDALNYEAECEKAKVITELPEE